MQGKLYLSALQSMLAIFLSGNMFERVIVSYFWWLAQSSSHRTTAVRPYPVEGDKSNVLTTSACSVLIKGRSV